MHHSGRILNEVCNKNQTVSDWLQSSRITDPSPSECKINKRIELNAAKSHAKRVECSFDNKIQYSNCVREIQKKNERWKKKKCKTTSDKTYIGYGHSYG